MKTMSKTLLLGATGYIGSAFATELQRRGTPFYALSRKELDYTRFDLLFAHLRETKPAFVINAAGYTGKPNVDACETARAETLQGNTLFPQSLAQACLATGSPTATFLPVASTPAPKSPRTATPASNPTSPNPNFRILIRIHSIRIRLRRPNGFTETDPPNFSFRSPPCSFYSGTKALGEEAMLPLANGYLWRLRIPFDEIDNPRNYLTKVQTYSKVYNNVNSISHRADFVGACLDLWNLQGAIRYLQHYQPRLDHHSLRYPANRENPETEQEV